MIKKLFIFIPVALIISACSNTVGNKNLGSESKINKQMASATTKAEVRDTFGAPTWVFKRDGADVHEYEKITGAGRYHWIIPIVGPIMSIWQDDYTFTGTYLYVKFDDKDKVKDWKIIKTSGTMD